MKSTKFYGFIMIAVGLLLAIGPWTFAHVCMGMEGMEPACHTTRLYSTVFGIIIVLLGIICMMIKRKAGAIVLSIILTICGAATIILPVMIAPVCEMADMHCRTHTMPFLIVAGIVMIVISVAMLMFWAKSGKKISKEESFVVSTDAHGQKETVPETVAPDQSETVSQDQSETVSQDQSETVSQDQSETVSQDQNELTASEDLEN